MFSPFHVLFGRTVMAEYQALLVCPGSSSDLKGIAVQCLHRSSQIGVFKRNSFRQIAVLNSTVSLKLHPLGNSPNPVECKDHIRHREGLTLFTTSGTGGKFRNPRRCDPRRARPLWWPPCCYIAVTHKKTSKRHQCSTFITFIIFHHLKLLKGAQIFLL